jgi:hypothetical protein
VPLALLIGGAAMKFFGSIFAGRAAKKAGQMEQDRQEYNAKIADLQAGDAIQRGVDASAKQRLATRQLIGTARAGFAAQNVDVSVGSALDVQADMALLGEIDAHQITANAEREAWGYEVQAVDRRMAGAIARQTGNAQGNAAYFGAVGGALTDAGGLATRYGFNDKPPAGFNPSPSLE